MEINVLYFLMRIYNLFSEFDTEKEDFNSVYLKILNSTDRQIVKNIPDDIKESAALLCTSFDSHELLNFKNLVYPYFQKCKKLLPDLSSANERFTSLLKDEFCSNGYFFKNGSFRKQRGNKLFVLECELVADFVADSLGRVKKISVSPFVRIASCTTKKQPDGSVTVLSGISDDNVTVSDIKLYEKKAFYRTLRHLDSIEYDINGDYCIGDEDIKKIAGSCLVAQSVCENRAIPSYYKKLCRNDFPFFKAFSISFISAFSLFILLSLLIALAVGVGIYLAFGFTKIFALLSEPYLYLVSFIISFIYGVYVFKKIKSGRF